MNLGMRQNLAKKADDINAHFPKELISTHSEKNQNFSVVAWSQVNNRLTAETEIES